VQSLDRPRRILACAIAALAGYVDAIGYLSVGGYFVSFMSGNTTRLATDLARDTRLALTPLLLISGFVGGVAISRALVAKAGRLRKPSVLAMVTALVAAGYFARQAESPTMALGAMVLAMGALNNTFHRGEVPIGLTYMTGALVRIGQGIGERIIGRTSTGLFLFLGLWLSLASGAIAGAFVFARFDIASLGYAVVASGALCLCSFAIPNR